MKHYMDDNTPGTSKKIKVRKLPSNNKTIKTNYDKDYYIPLAANDSRWNGINFAVPKNENTEHINSITDQETEIKVIEPQTSGNSPLLLLFPEIKNEELNVRSILNGQMSTTDITKILVGKKPNLALLKPCRKITNVKELSSLKELSDSDDLMEVRRWIRREIIKLEKQIGLNDASDECINSDNNL